MCWGQGTTARRAISKLETAFANKISKEINATNVKTASIFSQLIKNQIAWNALVMLEGRMKFVKSKMVSPLF